MRKTKSLTAVVYLARNIVNGKKYIGFTSRPLKRRISEHSYQAKKNIDNGAFHRAIRKYGPASFEFMVVKVCSSIEAAIQEEIRLISELRPEYNSTQGGDGQRGRTMSAESRKKISDFHKGKSWHKGRPHSEDTKRKLSEIGKLPINMERWGQFIHLGPRAMAKKVICHNDGLVYESATAAAKTYGVAKSALIELCLRQRNRKSVGGRQLSYVGLLQ